MKTVCGEIPSVLIRFIEISWRLIHFVMEEEYANLPLLKRFLKRAGVIPISANNRASLRRAFADIEHSL
ncbi:hypothetical protein, partial [Vibrio cholerae]|uniref:hypothetical protein n=1 Tax=Vibrio cholerae TaxID=666 RepID=UPI0011250669